MPNRFNKAIVVGDACVDVYLHLNDMLTNDKKKDIPYQVVSGGTSGNTVNALALLGVDTSFLGTIGNDYGGRFILDTLKKNNVDTSLTIVNNELNTVNVFSLIEDNGERHLWGFPRENVAYCDLDINKIDIDKVKTASWFHSSGMTLLNNGNVKETLPMLYKIAYESDVPTSFDFNTRVASKELLDEKSIDAIEKILPYVKYLTGSGKDEFICFNPCDDWMDSVRHFSNKDRVVIARNGSDYVFVVCDGQEYIINTYDVIAKNTTGAGDNFNAGFIASMLKNGNIIEAVKYGNAVAAYKISNDSSYNLNSEIIHDFMLNTKIK